MAVVIASTVVLASCGGSDEKVDTAAKLDDVADTVTRPIDRLADAVDAARPADRGSIVELKATAGRTGDEIGDARRELRDLERSASDEDRGDVRDLDLSLTDYQELADAIGRRSLSASAIEMAAERARQARRDSPVDLPAVAGDALAARLRRTKPKTADADGGLSAPVGGGEATAEPSGTTDYRNYTGPAFQARVPTGSGWASPSQSEPSPGELFRTNVRGPNGLFVIIDFTPLETAKFGGGFDSRTEVGQTAFGSATRYVFSGGRIPECRSTTCVDYIINSGGASGGSGFAVLAGGGDEAAQIAQTVAESVTPIGEYDD